MRASLNRDRENKRIYQLSLQRLWGLARRIAAQWGIEECNASVLQKMQGRMLTQLGDIDD